jgi:hypothetical protein
MQNLSKDSHIPSDIFAVAVGDKDDFCFSIIIFACFPILRFHKPARRLRYIVAFRFEGQRPSYYFSKMQIYCEQTIFRQVQFPSDYHFSKKKCKTGYFSDLSDFVAIHLNGNVRFQSALDVESLHSASDGFHQRAVFILSGMRPDS